MAHTSGHLGLEATIKALESAVYWSSFRKDTRDYISRCFDCKEKSAAHPNPEFGENPSPPHAWHTVGMDLLQLPLTRRGHKYLLVMVDILTRFAVAAPLSEKSALLVVKAIRKNILSNPLLGPPSVLVSDNGTEFSNSSMKSLLRPFGTKQVFASPYNPKGNGSTERLNRTLLAILRGLLSPKIEWDLAIKPVLEIYNNTPHSSIRMSPFEAISGRPPRHPQLLPDILSVRPSAQLALTEANLPGTAARLRERLGGNRNLQEAWTKAEERWVELLDHHFGNLRETSQVSKHLRISRANETRSAPTISVDDLVVVKDVHRPPGVEGKIRRPYNGPWIVTQAHKKSVRLSDLDGNPLPRLVPLDQVRLWHSNAPTKE
jgi:transposase InsO family protein